MSMTTPVFDIMLSKQVLHFFSLHMTLDAVGKLKLGINSPGSEDFKVKPSLAGRDILD